MDELDELIDFLAAQKPEVKLTALKIVESLTGSPDGIDKLKPKAGKLMVFILRLLADVPAISKAALTILVNLSQDPHFGTKLLEMNVVGRCMDYIREQTCAHPRLLIMLLNNLTVTEQGCRDLLQIGQGKLEGLHVAVLLKKFVMSGIIHEEGKEDAFEHVASIVTNMTRLKQGRELLLQPGRGLLQALVAQLKAPSLLRRQGAAGAIKNCCISAEEDGTLENILSDETVLSYMLVPINGLEPKEKDDMVREALAESVMVLASSRVGRKALWKVKAPEIVQKGYELEEHPGVCKALEHAAEEFLFNAEADNGEPEGEDKSEPSGAKQEEEPSCAASGSGSS